MKNHLVIFFITALLMLITNCKNIDLETDGLGSFDLSPDDKQIVFSYSNNGQSSLYVINIDGSHLKMILKSNEDISYFNPKYSPDGGKIAFISNKRGNINSALCLVNNDGTNLVYLMNDKQIITDETFSKNGESIYFCKANVYDKYSPIGVKDFHNYDIYSINLKNRNIIKVSNFMSYEMGNLNDIDSTTLLFSLGAGYNSGIYLYAKNNIAKPKRIVPINNPRKDASLYYNPIYSDSLKIIGFTAPYEIYIMNLKDKIAKLIFSNKGDCNIGNLVFFKKQSKILFSKTCSYSLFSINIDGTDLRIIPIFNN